MNLLVFLSRFFTFRELKKAVTYLRHSPLKSGIAWGHFFIHLLPFFFFYRVFCRFSA
jgi:hypothetical protein